MAYSQAKVIAGGLTHIPIIITVFYFILTTFNKRALEFAEVNKPIKLKYKGEESKTEKNALITVKAKIEEIKESELKEEKAKTLKELSNKLEEIKEQAEDVKDKVKKEKNKNKNKKKNKKKGKDMTRD